MNLETIESGLKSFDDICNLVSTCSVEEIIGCLSKAAGISERAMALQPMGGYSKGKNSGCYYFVLKDLKENLSRYQWIYARLADSRSREVFLNLIRFRIFPNKVFLKSACDSGHDQYFCPEIVRCGKEEVFVDCGGFTGDTTENFIKNYKDYKHIYIYEPSAENIKQCRKTVSQYDRITIRQCGVGKKKSEAAFAQNGSSSSFVGNNQTESNKIKVVCLDQDITEPVSFIKMDIECSEIDALIGAKRHIQKDFPKLAICVYHILSDIWEIAQIIDTICPQYRFYMRHYNEDQNWETVLYAIPIKTVKKPASLCKKEKIGVYSMEGSCGYWVNAQLTKDCGAVPYLFYKRYGYRAVMVSRRCPELTYPSLETAVKGMTLDFLPDDADVRIAEIKYIIKHYQEMDIFVLYGPYPPYFPVLDTYRKLRPDGKVYLALDANPDWMDRMVLTPALRKFMDQCDVIATSSKVMQKHLSMKWPYKIEYIPNGFYNFANCSLRVQFSKKENVLLTVGRIGIAQKNNELLLQAFAQIADKIPEWSLRLVGNIENSFQTYIETYFRNYPELKNRVIFTGNILDKRQLMEEYKKAKIFVLTSRWEGGTPNVIAEALYGGCYMVTAPIDAADDAVDGGRCGQIFTSDEQLAPLLVRICHQPEILKKGGNNAVKYARRVYDYTKIIKRLHYLLFQEDRGI